MAAFESLSASNSPSAARGAPSRPPVKAAAELARFLKSFRGVLIGLAFLSAVINLLVLNGTIFMLEVYDRVLPSRSVPTLVGLSILALSLFLVQGLLEFLRSRALAEMGASLDESFGRRVYDAVVRLPLISRGGGDGLQPFRDLDQVRNFLGGAGPTALFDLPWMPIYLIVAMMFHPWIGIMALVSCGTLAAVALAAEVLSRQPAEDAAQAAVSRNSLALASRRNSEVIRAMGMGRSLGGRWLNSHLAHLSANLRANHVAGALGSLSRSLRLILQSAVLALGAYLAIKGEMSSGSMIACSVLLSRALAPVELSIAHWKSFVASRDSWRRLNLLLRDIGTHAEPLPLPAPRHSLQVENIFVNAPGGLKPILLDVSFALDAGQGLGVIGPSASGKSTLARAITGVWPAARGSVRIDGAELAHWSPELLGPHIGYLPQDVDLFDGTIAQNIARFREDRRSRRTSSRRPAPRASTISSCASPPPTTRSSARPARHCRPVSASASASPARCSASRSSWSSTSRTRASTLPARKRSPSPSPGCAPVAASSSSWRTGPAPSSQSTRSC